MIRILVIRTHYPQWASRSGINQYLNHLDKSAFSVSEHLVPMGDHLFPVQVSSVKNFVRKRVQGGGNFIYDLNDLRAEWSVFRKVCLDEFDIVQYCDPEHTLQYLCGWLHAARFIKRKKPVVVGMYHQPTSVLKSLMSPRLGRCLDHIVLMSEEQRKFFGDEIAESRISVILHGIDTSYYKPDYSKRDKRRYKCLTVGHWLRDYDVLEMIAERLAVDGSIEFHVVSSTRLRNARDNVFYHQDIDDLALLDLYQQCNLLLMPFKDATANNAIMEGIGCGLPVLTTDLPATREYLSAGDAFFVGNNNVDEYVECILGLRELELKKQLGEKSRGIALDLSWQIIAKEYEALYYKLTEKRKLCD